MLSRATDIMRRLNKKHAQCAPRWYRLPQERELAAQYLLLMQCDKKQPATAPAKEPHHA